MSSQLAAGVVTTPNLSIAIEPLVLSPLLLLTGNQLFLRVLRREENVFLPTISVIMSRNAVVRHGPLLYSCCDTNGSIGQWADIFQGEVYSRVISDVYDKSRDDFEMGGVDLGTLDLLKSVSELCDLLFFHASTSQACLRIPSSSHLYRHRCEYQAWKAIETTEISLCCE